MPWNLFIVKVLQYLGPRRHGQGVVGESEQEYSEEEEEEIKKRLADLGYI